MILHSAYIGVGSNLQNPLLQVKQGIEKLTKVHDCYNFTVSHYYLTAPQGQDYVGQPDFVNAVVKLETTLEPLVLLGALQKIEHQQGRDRQTAFDARTLDLDILFLGDLKINTPTLTIPHQRLKIRAFVLCPLYDLLPEGYLPTGEKIEPLLVSCQDQKVSLLQSTLPGDKE